MKKPIAILLCLVFIFSLAACGKKSAPDSVITVAKDRDSLESGSKLSAEDASALMKQLAAAGKASAWMNGTVSNSIASCYISIEINGEETLYQYSDTGVLDDLTNMRSLTLSDAEAVNGILSEYVELGLKLARIPDLAPIPINP